MTDFAHKVQLAQNTLTALQKLEAGKMELSLTKRADAYNEISQQFSSATQTILESAPLHNRVSLTNQFIEVFNETTEHFKKARAGLSHNSPATDVTYKNLDQKYQNLVSLVVKENSTLLELNSQTTKLILFLSVLVLNILTLIATCFQLVFRLSMKTSELNSALNTFKTAMNNMTEGVIVTDRQGFFTYYNAAALEIIGKGFSDVHYESSIQKLGFYNLDKSLVSKDQLPFYHFKNHQENSEKEYFVQNAAHAEGIYISASVGHLMNSRGNITGSVVVMKNISQKKQLERLWQDEKEKALLASKNKSDFLASMSHEIRTPMNGIIGLSTLLSDTNLSLEQKDYVQTIKTSAHALLSLINDILDHSKIEAGKIELQPHNFNLRLLLKDICDSFKFVTEEKNIHLNLEFSNEVSPNYIADSNRLRQILFNLIGNAVKFTQEGSVTVKVENSGDKLKFSVKDTGFGMTPAEVQNLFKRFFQTKSGIKFGGTGLGLSISKQLVDLFGGEINVESEFGVGTTFYFTLALPISQEQLIEKTVHEVKFQKKFQGHVLVAEDNSVNQKVAKNYLAKLGVTVDVANNGQEAVNLFKQNKYHMIFMDCQMPILNGYEATKQILDLQTQGYAATDIIALTAEGTSGERSKCYAAGMKGFLNKPLVLEQLLNILEKYLPHSNDSFKAEELEKLKDLKVGDQLLLEVLLEEYAASTPDLISQMKNYVQDYPNTDDTSHLAHSLKSSSASLGAMSVSDLCYKIEKNIFNSKEELVSLISQLETEYEKSIEDIKLAIDTIKNEAKAA